MDVEHAAKVMGVMLLVVGTLVLGMGVGTTASMLVVTDGCDLQPTNADSLGLQTEPPACQQQAQTLSMWADCMFASGLFLLLAGIGALYYLDYTTRDREQEVAG